MNDEESALIAQRIQTIGNGRQKDVPKKCERSALQTTTANEKMDN